MTKLLVLGGGPGGYAGAFHAADLGLDVTLVDLEPNPGGVCLYRGCIPSKALLHVAKLIRDSHEAQDCGVTFGEPKIDMDKLRGWKNGVVSKLTGGLGQLRKARKIAFHHGRGRFLDAHSLRVELAEGGSKDVSFDYCMLATGSRPVMPPAFNIGSSRVIDSTGALAIEDVPETMLVIGGGYIGLEMAMVYESLGTKVTVVEMAGGLIPGADRDLAEPLIEVLKQRLAGIHTHTRVCSMREEGEGILVELSGLAHGEAEQRFDKVLVAVGRAPNTGNLGLENTKVRVIDHGFIKVDHQRRTNEPSIFAVGDVAGQPMLAHKASYEARMAAEVIAGKPAAFDAQSIPAVMFTDPEVAWCGLTESEAIDKNLPVKISRYPWGASGRAMTLNRKEGLTKIIANPTTGQILGVGMVGPGAGELLAEGSFAVEIGARMEDLKMTIHAHPTLSETVMEAAEAFFGSSTHFYTKM